MFEILSMAFANITAQWKFFLGVFVGFIVQYSFFKKIELMEDKEEK